MRGGTRGLLDRSFTVVGALSIALMAGALLTILAPILKRGVGAYAFTATVEHRRLLLEKFGRGDRRALARDLAATEAARRPVYERLSRFEADLDAMKGADRRRYREPLQDFKEALRELLGPLPGEPSPVLVRKQYGQTRWDRALVKRHRLLYVESWDYSDPAGMGVRVDSPRVEEFRGTALEPAFACVEANLRAMLSPRFTFYAGFLTDASLDAHFFGGIWPEVLGTIYLTLGAMLFALPLGVVAAIYFTEYAGDGRLVGLLRTCVSTLAGVPSIVFGMFGLAFFIHTLGVSDSKSVLAGALTLSLLILPTIIRASEEAIRSVPHAYKEAALSLGATRWRALTSVILPAALPGILTGSVISMGRAAGETAPIIFTAAVSVGKALKPWETLSQPTPVLSWNIYNLCTEHEAVDEIRHVQFGMVATLVLIVLLLNMAAIVFRARISRKLRG